MEPLARAMKSPMISDNDVRRGANRPTLVLLALTLLCGATGVRAEVSPSQPEGPSGFSAKPALAAHRFVAVTANSYASDTAAAILKEHGSAVDAAIAAQMVLNLVEPQSSGIGGGAFLLFYDAARRRLRAYDGRETAPSAATADMFLDRDGKPLNFMTAVVGGKAVGVPGTLRALELAHRRHGRLPWARLFEPAIRLAEQGFAISPRLHAALATEKYLTQPEARAYFYGGDGKPRPVGYILRNPEFAAVLRRVAREGADAFYRGEIARDIIATVRTHPVNPGVMTEADLAAFRAQEREPLCGPYRGYRLCGMPPPSSGTTTVLAMLGMLERFNLREIPPDSAFGVHLFAEAGRLAYADRNLYVADPAFVPMPLPGLIDPAYLGRRSAMIRYDDSMGKAAPGAPPMETRKAARLGEDRALELPATSHLSIIDRDGNALAMTTTIEAGFGSRQMVHGFLLNNELTDFSFVPVDDGKPIANRIEPGKRPRSSMAPMIVFDRAGKVDIVIGSPGGQQIIHYVARTLIALIDWQLAPDAALALPHVGSSNGPTELEKDTDAESLASSLRVFGHELRVTDMTSGLHLIRRAPGGWLGAADPRREGEARGE